MRPVPISDDDEMRIELKNNQPVELADYTLSMLALSNEYGRMLVRTYGAGANNSVKVYVKEMKSGSIITDIVAVSATAVPAMLPHIEHISTLLEYAKSLKKSYDYLTGKSDVPVELDRHSLNNLSQIVQPVAKDNGAQMNVITNNTYNGPVYQFGIDSMEANAAQNGIRRKLDSKELPVTGTHNRVVLHLYQARSAVHNHAIDRGIIESISPAAVKLDLDDATKAAMILNNENPFRMAFVVDVQVETVKNKPVLYKILNLWNKFSIDEGQTPSIFDHEE